MNRLFASCAAGLACAVFLSAAHHGKAQTAAPILAVVAFNYVDTSGETRDQRADHAARLKAFMESLQNDLGKSGKFRVIALDCSSIACAGLATSPADLVAATEKTGAAYILWGGIHKVSTLIQQANAEILDVGTQKVVFDRLLSFRGDDDTAWQRAEAFLVRDILEQTPFK